MDKPIISNEKLNMKCEKCRKICDTKRFQQNFKNWTSGNNNIDKFIQDTQLSYHDYNNTALEWIPYDKFEDIEYIAKGGFAKVYVANWIDGPILGWDDKNENWDRGYRNKTVALKSLDNSKNISLEFLNEIKLHQKINRISKFCHIIKFHGITQDPETKNYMMVLDYAKDGSLRNYLDEDYCELGWHDKIRCLHSIAHGLAFVHGNEIIHRDLHVGNILGGFVICITDMGLCKPADYNASENTKNRVYGVLPYIAPEILRGQNYTKASDIYSFGIIMYEIISGLPPYHDVSHDKNLALKICQGFRPRFNIKVPQQIVHLIKRCLDANPLNRPTAKEIIKMLSTDYTKLREQIKEADEVNKNLSISSMSSTSLGLPYETHSEAIYTSRLLDFSNLPEPKNSIDYYERYDNIVSLEYSVSQQINISQLEYDRDNKSN